MKVQKYKNGSYAYWSNRVQGWRNIPEQVAKSIMKTNFIKKIMVDFLVVVNADLKKAEEDEDIIAATFERGAKKILELLITEFEKDDIF